MPLNPCELEIDLFCRGMRIDPGVSLAGVRGISRTRAGLGSGLEIAIPVRSAAKREIWVNVPVVERFAQSSPYLLIDAGTGVHAIRDERTGDEYAVRLPLEPDWYGRLTSTDVPMNRVGVLQGTYLAIYANPVCAFWNYSPSLNCRFCTTGQNVGANEAPVKALTDVVETCWAAKEESGVTFVHLNGGYQGSRGIEFIKPYVRAIKEDVRAARRRAARAGEGLFPLRRAGGAWRRPPVVLRGAAGSRVVRAHLSRQGARARAAALLCGDAVRGRPAAARRGLGGDHCRHRAGGADDRGGRPDYGARRVSDRLHLPADGRQRHGVVAAA